MAAIAAVETALFTAFRFVSNGQGHASRHWLLPALENGWDVVTLTSPLDLGETKTVNYLQPQRYILFHLRRRPWEKRKLLHPSESAIMACRWPR